MNRKSSKKYKVKSIKEKFERSEIPIYQDKNLSEAKSRNPGEKVERSQIPKSREKSRFSGRKSAKELKIKNEKGKSENLSKAKSRFIGWKIEKINAGEIDKKADITGRKPKNIKEKKKYDKTLPVVNAKVEVSTNKKINVQKSASIGWKYFLDKQGNPLMKIYTENSLVYFKLEKYGEIKKSARYYTHKGDLVGADFIVPFNLIPTACGLAGIKTPKGIPAAGG